MTIDPVETIKNRMAQYLYLAGYLVIILLLIYVATFQIQFNLRAYAELIASIIALIVGVIALIRYYSKNDRTILLLGVAFIGTSLLDGFHSLLSSEWMLGKFDVQTPLIFWSSFPSRLFLSTMFFMSWWVWDKREKYRIISYLNDRMAYFLCGIYGLATFMFFISYPLPRSYYPELFFTRPLDFIPALFFALAFIGYFYKGSWKKEAFEHWVMISMIFNFFSSMYICFSQTMDDKLTLASLIFKLSSYLSILVGLLISMYELFHTAVTAREQLETHQDQLAQAEKLASIGQLAAGIAHEINNPTAFIKNNLIVLERYINKYNEIYTQLEDYNKKKNKKSSSMMSKMTAVEIEEMLRAKQIHDVYADSEDLIKETLDGLNRIEKIVGNLLTYSRKDKSAKVKVNLKNLMENALTLITNEIKYRVRIDKEFRNTPPVIVEAQSVVQVFVNLIINAAQSIEEGNKQGILTIRIYAGDKNVFVEVIDNGSGIEEENIKRIFDPFYTTKPVGVGTGLGLGICYEIMQAQGGRILVSSKSGVGTTFTLVFPKIEEAQDSSKDKLTKEDEHSLLNP